MKVYTTKAQPVLSVRKQATLKTILSDIGKIPETLIGHTMEKGLQPAGPLVFVYRGLDSNNMDAPFELEIAQPLAEASKVSSGDIKARELESFRYIQDMYQGDIAGLGPNGYEPFIAEAIAAGHKIGSECREIYLRRENPGSKMNEVLMQIGV